MNARVLWVALFLASGTAAAADETSHWLVGVQLGWANGEVESKDLNSHIAPANFDATASVGDSHRLGWRVYSGYRFTDYFALQVGYTDLGKVESHFNGASSESIQTFLRSVDLPQAQSAHGVDVGMSFKYPLADDRLALTARGGAYFWRSEYRVSGFFGDQTEYRDRGGDAFYGAGAEIYLLRDLSATVDWSRYRAAGEHIGLWSVGFMYRFGEDY